MAHCYNSDEELRDTFMFDTLRINNNYEGISLSLDHEKPRRQRPNENKKNYSTTRGRGRGMWRRPPEEIHPARMIGVTPYSLEAFLRGRETSVNENGVEETSSSKGNSSPSLSRSRTPQHPKEEESEEEEEEEEGRLIREEYLEKYASKERLTRDFFGNYYKNIYPLGNVTDGVGSDDDLSDPIIGPPFNIVESTGARPKDPPCLEDASQFPALESSVKENSDAPNKPHVLETSGDCGAVGGDPTRCIVINNIPTNITIHYMLHLLSKIGPVWQIDLEVGDQEGFNKAIVEMKEQQHIHDIFDNFDSSRIFENPRNLAMECSFLETHPMMKQL